jgi:hypothetical protein
MPANSFAAIRPKEDCPVLMRHTQLFEHDLYITIGFA